MVSAHWETVMLNLPLPAGSATACSTTVGAGTHFAPRRATVPLKAVASAQPAAVYLLNECRPE